MTRVQHDKTHALEDAALDTIDDGVGHLAVGHVSPPDQDIRVFQPLLAQTVSRLVEPGRADGQLHIPAQERRDRLVHAVGIKSGNRGILFFVAKLAPDSDTEAHGGKDIATLVARDNDFPGRRLEIAARRANQAHRGRVKRRKDVVIDGAAGPVTWRLREISLISTEKQV